MSTMEATDENCRLTVIAAALRVDLAVPVRMAVAELLSIVVSSLGQDAADRGVSEGGWVLQRAAEDALDPSRSLAASRVRDGEVLYLRTGSARLAPAVFDDVLDAVATAVATRTSRWQPVHTMRTTAGFAAATLSVTLFALVLIGPPWTCTSIVAGFAAVALESAALALGRGHACSAPAFVAAGFAVAYGVVGAATAVGGAEQVWRFGALPSLIAPVRGRRAGHGVDARGRRRLRRFRRRHHRLRADGDRYGHRSMFHPHRRRHRRGGGHRGAGRLARAPGARPAIVAAAAACRAR